MSVGDSLELKFLVSVNISIQGQEYTQQFNIPVNSQLPIISKTNDRIITFSKLYEKLLSELDKYNKVSIKTIRSNHSVLNRFEKWCMEKFSVKSGYCVSFLSQPNILKDYAEYLRSGSKGSSAMWAKHVDRSASSYMLHHAIAEERVSKTTTDCYLQDNDILREITAAIETLPVWQVS